MFVSDNDIFWIESIEHPNNPVRVTLTGEEKIMFNGIPDWVYEGECLVAIDVREGGAWGAAAVPIF